MSASAGKVLLTPKGDFSTSATYSILDWVRYNGGVYVAKQTTTGNLPTDTTYWEKMNDSVSTLSGLSDVNITNIADGETLIWDATNSEWVNGTIAGGGSYITLTTTTEQGENVSMSIGGATYTGTFSSEGICTFEGVKETGTATISTARVTTTLVIEYYGSYVAVVEYVPAHTYGVEWDGTSTTVWSRTDESAEFTDPIPYVSGASNYGSPFDNLMPWSGMVIEERTGGTMVKIPKFWYKLTQNGAGMKIQISDKEQDGFHVSPAHMNRGDGKGERDYVYVGRYHCGATAYKSVSGQLPKANITRSEARSAIHNLGTNIWQMDFATRFTIWLLYLVEFADWNSQEKIGYGCGNGNSTNTQAMGYTDSMPYHTGTTLANRTTYGFGTQYRYIEGLWDNVYDYLDGCYYNSYLTLYTILDPSLFSDSTNGTMIATQRSGYPSAFSIKSVDGSFPMFVSTVGGGSDTTYSCDGWSMFKSAPCICAGGETSHSGDRGLFCITGMGASGVSSSGDYWGSRLMELPDNT